MEATVKIGGHTARVFWSDTDRGYIAAAPAFPRLSGFGAKAADAVRELESVLAAAVEIYRQERWPLPRAG